MTLLEREKEGRTAVACMLALAFGFFGCLIIENTLTTFLVSAVIGAVTGYVWCHEEVKRARESI